MVSCVLITTIWIFILKTNGAERIPKVVYIHQHAQSIHSKHSYYTFFRNGRNKTSKTKKITDKYNKRESQKPHTREYDLFMNDEDTKQLNNHNKNRIYTKSNVEYKIPNIVHYVWYNYEKVPLPFHNLLSIMSAYKVLKPESIYFHTNNTPTGTYWQLAKRFVTVIYREPTRELYGRAIRLPPFVTSDSNVDRVKILSEYGGYYLDMDVLVVRSMDDLREHECVLGYELPGLICGGVILCSNTSPFLQMWLKAFASDYKPYQWGYNSGKVPSKLASQYPSLVHIVPMAFHRPNYNEIDVLFRPTQPNMFNWHDNYVLHLWHTVWNRHLISQSIKLDPVSIKYMDNVIGQIGRTIYYGSDMLLS